MIYPLKYSFSGKIWQHAGPGGWVFISLPAELSREIRDIFGREEQGWGRLAVKATWAENDWKTAIWYDTRQQTYLLPLKAEIRKKTGMGLGDMATIEIEI